MTQVQPAPGQSVGQPAATAPLSTVQPAPASISPTNWAQMVLGDMSQYGVQVTPQTTADILSWMPNEEPTSQWWGGFGTASDPTRINPLNMTGSALPNSYGYAATPLTGNQLGGGLGTFPTLADAAAAEAEGLGVTAGFKPILQALQQNAGFGQFAQALVSSGYAQSGYGGNVANFNAGTAAQAQGGPPVTSSSANQGAGSIAGTIQGQLTPQELSNLGAADAISQQLNLSPQELAFQQQILQQNYGYSQQQFGLQADEMGIQNLQQQAAQKYNIQQYGFEQQRNTLTGQNIEQSINNILQNYGYTQQGFGIAQQQLDLSHQQANQAQAASGVLNTGTHAQSEQAFGQSQARLNLQEQQAQTQEQYQLFQQNQAQKSLGLTEAQQKAQLGYSQQQFDYGQQLLNDQYKSLGITQQQAYTQYQNALQQLGLNNVMNVLQLEQQIAVMAGGGYSPMSGMLQQLQGVLPFLGGLFQNMQGGSSGG